MSHPRRLLLLFPWTQGAEGSQNPVSLGQDLSQCGQARTHEAGLPGIWSRSFAGGNTLPARTQPLVAQLLSEGLAE